MRGHPWDAACPQPRVGALGVRGAVVEELTGWDCLQLWGSAWGGSTCGCTERAGTATEEHMWCLRPQLWRGACAHAHIETQRVCGSTCRAPCDMCSTQSRWPSGGIMSSSSSSGGSSSQESKRAEISPLV